MDHDLIALQIKSKRVELSNASCKDPDDVSKFKDVIIERELPLVLLRVPEDSKRLGPLIARTFSENIAAYILP